MTGPLAGLVQFARGFGYGMHGWPGYPSRGWGFPLASVFTALVFAGLVAAVIVLSVRLARRSALPSEEAIGIARARYAREEISKNEFEELKRDLS